MREVRSGWPAASQALTGSIVWVFCNPARSHAQCKQTRSLFAQGPVTSIYR